jgi:cellulose biosynthesis protein BcsQ
MSDSKEKTKHSRKTVRFDDSLPAFVEIISEKNKDWLSGIVIIRDAWGVLSAVLNFEPEDKELSDLNKTLIKRLGKYARNPDTVRGMEAPGAKTVLNEGLNVRALQVAGYKISLIDRRIVGADWLAEPGSLDADVPRVAFISLKGGVGRSTALAVAAVHMARKGLRVLAVDLDLEAPGLGSLLLDKETLPRYGAVDWLIEDGMSGIDDLFRADSIGASPLAPGVSVMPAFGRATYDNPAEGMAKIARAPVEDMDVNGTVPFRTQVRTMLDTCAASGEYDLILIDGRAGLHETTAAVALASGARVLLFGRDESQTYMGYQLLLAHIDGRLKDGAAWRERALLVHAQAPAGDTSEARRRFEELWRGPRSQAIDAGPRLGIDDFDVVWPEDEDVDVDTTDDGIVLKIRDDARYRGFRPLDDRKSVDESVYSETFKDLLSWLDDVVSAKEKV